MDETKLNERLMKSRMTESGWARALAAGELAAPKDEYQRMIAAEVVILRQLAVEHPRKASTIAGLIEKYEALSRHIGWNVH